MPSPNSPQDSGSNTPTDSTPPSPGLCRDDSRPDSQKSQASTETNTETGTHTDADTLSQLCPFQRLQSVTHLIPSHDDRALAEQIDFANAMLLLLFGMGLFFAATSVLLTDSADTSAQTSVASDRAADRLADDLFVNGSPTTTPTASTACLESFFNRTANPTCGQTGPHYNSTTISSLRFAQRATGMPSDFAINITVRNADGDVVRWNAPANNATVSTRNASSRTATSATLTATYTVDGQLSQPPSIQFQYRKANSIPWTTVPADAVQPGRAGVTIQSLTPNTTYEYRAVIDVYGDSDIGQQRTVTTPPTSVAILTRTADAGLTEATLRANLTTVAGTDTATVSFEYGKAGSTDLQTVDVGEQTTGLVSTTVSDLEPSTTYEFRPIAQTASGTDKGSNQSFTTDEPNIETTTSNPEPGLGDTTVLGGTITSVTGTPPFNASLILIGSDPDTENQRIDAGQLNTAGEFSRSVSTGALDSYSAFKAVANLSVAGVSVSDEGNAKALPRGRSQHAPETSQTASDPGSPTSLGTASTDSSPRTLQTTPTVPHPTELAHPPDNTVQPTHIAANPSSVTTHSVVQEPASPEPSHTQSPTHKSRSSQLHDSTTQVASLLSFQSSPSNSNITRFTVGAPVDPGPQQATTQALRVFRVTLPDGSTEFWTLEVTVWHK